MRAPTARPVLVQRLRPRCRFVIGISPVSAKRTNRGLQRILAGGLRLLELRGPNLSGGPDLDVRLVAVNRVAGRCCETAQELRDNEARAGSREDFRLRALWYDGRAAIGPFRQRAIVGLQLKLQRFCAIQPLPTAPPRGSTSGSEPAWIGRRKRSCFGVRRATVVQHEHRQQVVATDQTNAWSPMNSGLPTPANPVNGAW